MALSKKYTNSSFLIILPIGSPMDLVNYYLTTLTAAFKNLAPILAFLVGGYFIFVKMPFLFLRKNMADQKKKLDEKNKDVVQTEKYTVDDYKKFQDSMKILNGKPEESKTKKERPKEEKKKEEKKERPASAAKSPTRSPEEVLGFKPGDAFTQIELKKRYFELLKQNHPDRVASMGPDFKKLAENNTKEINKAFETLKKKAS